MKFSVLTASLNQARYIRESVDSIESQRFSGVEHVVNDGMSTDGTRDILAESTASVVYQSDSGQVQALNSAWGRASGDIVSILNTDDLLFPGSIARVAQEFEDPDVNWVIGGACEFWDSGDALYANAQNPSTLQEWLKFNPVMSMASFWRTTASHLVGAFSEVYPWSFDYEYWLRLRFIAGWKPVLVPYCVGGLRVHPASKGQSQFHRFEEDNRRIRAEYARLRAAGSLVE